MAEKLGEAVLELRTDDSQLDAGIARAEAKAEGVAAKFESVGKRMQNVGGKLSAGLTLPLTAFGIGAFKAASDAAELESAFDVTFGNMAGAVRKWAEETGNAMGRSTQEMMGMAAQFQDILKKQMDPAAAAEMSKQLTVLTQDLASFKNLSNEEAQQKIFSGLIGESEPLRSVGVILNENGVAAKAMAMGLAESRKELTEGDKVQARAALIMEQLADAQGDVIRTSDSAANQVKEMHAAWDELQVGIGTKLLPVFTPLIAGLASAINWVGSLPEPVQNVVVYLGLLAAAAGPVLMAVGSIGRGVGVLIPLMTRLGPLIGLVSKALLGLLANPILLAAAAVIMGIYLAWQHWDEIKAIVGAVGAAVTEWWNANVQPVLDAVGAKIEQVIGWFAGLPGKIGASLSSAYSAVKTWLQDRLGPVFDWISGAIGRVTGFYADLAKRGIESVRSLYTGVKTWLVDKFNALVELVMKPIRAVESGFAWLTDRVVGHSHVPDMVDGIAEEMARLPEVMVAPAEQAVAAVDGAFGTMGELSPLQQWAQSIPQTAGQISAAFQSIAARGLDTLATAITDVIMGTASLKEAFGDMARSIIAEIIHMTVRMLIFRAISSALGGLFGGGGGGPLPGGMSDGSNWLYGDLFSGFFASGGLIPAGTFGVVGEKGPEPVIATSRGAMVLPNSTLAGAAASQRSVVELHVKRGELFEAEVVNISGDVAVQVVQATAPSIAREARRETLRAISRPGLP